jgi:peptidoglycan/xylan/chitin deacetylase (PgdA/CDA1 family)
MFDRFAQRTFYELLRWTGIIAAWRWRQRDQLTVLCIHGVAHNDDVSALKPTRQQLSVDELDRQLAVLTRKYRFISIGEVQRVLSEGSGNGKPCCLFTIDDGYTSAWELAWPVLKRHGVPAVVFVATHQMQTVQPFWWDRLDYVMLNLPDDVREVKLGKHSLAVDLTDRVARARSARSITRQSRKLFDHDQARFAAIRQFIEEHEQDQWASDMKSWVGVMSEQQVADASEDGFEIGGHTINHYRLGNLDRETVRTELTESKAELERVTKKPCRAFCFPEGSFNDVSREEVEAAGYELAFCSRPGLNDASADRHALRRFHLPLAGSTAYLLAHTSGLTEVISSLKSRLIPGRT